MKTLDAFIAEHQQNPAFAAAFRAAALGESLIAARLARRWSRSRLARALRVTTSQIVDLEQSTADAPPSLVQAAVSLLLTPSPTSPPLSATPPATNRIRSRPHSSAIAHKL